MIFIFNPRSVSLWFTDRIQTLLYYALNYTFISIFRKVSPTLNLKSTGNCDSPRRNCWRWEINFITFALRSRHYPRLHHQPITVRRAVYIIIAEVAISRSSPHRSIMVNPAAARNNKGSNDSVGADGVLVIIPRTCRRKRKRSSRALLLSSPVLPLLAAPAPSHVCGRTREKGGWVRWFF